MPPRGDYPSSKQDQYMLRFPGDMRAVLKAEAERNNRSLNAEIIARLEESLEPKSLRGTALAMNMAMNLALAVDQALGNKEGASDSASSMLTHALNGQSDWDDIQEFAEHVRRRINELRSTQPPPIDEIPEERELSEFERDMIVAQRDLMKSLMRKHGVNFINNEDLAKDESK